MRTVVVSDGEIPVRNSSSGNMSERLRPREFVSSRKAAAFGAQTSRPQKLRTPTGSVDETGKASPIMTYYYTSPAGSSEEAEDSTTNRKRPEASESDIEI